MAQIIWSDSSIDDLRAIGEFYERSSPAYASIIVTELYTSVSQLRDYPQSGRIVPELNEQPIRELVVRGFRIVYKLTRDKVRIVTVLHSRQDLSDKLSDLD